MSIDPLKSGNLPNPARAGQTGAQGAQSTRGGAPVRGGDAQGQPPASAAHPQDRVQLSSDYQTLVEQARASGASDPSGLDPARLRTILDRIKTGFYDSAEVRDQVARRVQGDLGGPAGA